MIVQKKDDDLKLYYSIGEVSEMMGLSKSLIRFWDSEFEMLKPHKNSKGDRRFTKKNIEQLKMIRYLTKDRGFTLKGARIELKKNRKQLQERSKNLHSLEQLKSFLERLKDEI